MIDMLLVFGVIAVILLVTALASGIVERSPLSFPLMFLGLGLVLGKQGFGAIELGPHDQVLEVYRDFGFDEVLVKLSTRPEKRVGDDALWDQAEQALEQVLMAYSGTLLFVSHDRRFTSLLAQELWVVDQCRNIVNIFRQSLSAGDEFFGDTITQIFPKVYQGELHP
ncbi:MAG: hypothetical protein IIB17_02605 [Chloroflexi bacterium]|nr:hypothetical protein [Chloroflexota bacterium]